MRPRLRIGFEPVLFLLVVGSPFQRIFLIYTCNARERRDCALSPFTFWKNLFSFYELPVLPDNQKPCKSRTFFGSRLSSRGLGLDYLDCYGDPQELSFGDEGLDLLYKARRIEGSGEAEREVLQSYFFCRRIRADICLAAA